MKDEIRDIYYAYDEYIRKKFWGFELGNINEMNEDETYSSWPIYFLLLHKPLTLKTPTTLKLMIDNKTCQPIIPPASEFDRIKSSILLNPDFISVALKEYLKPSSDEIKFQISSPLYISSPLDVHKHLHETLKVFLTSKYETIAFKNNPNIHHEKKIGERVFEIKSTLHDSFDKKIISFNGERFVERIPIADYLALMDLANVRMLYGGFLEANKEKTPGQAIEVSLKIYEALLDNLYCAFYSVIPKGDVYKLKLATSDKLLPEEIDFLIDEQNYFLNIETHLPKHKKAIGAVCGFSYYLYLIDLLNKSK